MSKPSGQLSAWSAVPHSPSPSHKAPAATPTQFHATSLEADGHSQDGTRLRQKPQVAPASQAPQMEAASPGESANSAAATDQ